jgi:hypothetical protein
MAATLLTAVYQATSVLDVGDYREVTLLIDIDSGAATNALSIIPLLSGQIAPPLVTDDVWFTPTVNDGTVTAGTPGGTALAGVDVSLAPEFGTITQLPLELLTQATDNASDEQRLAITIKCPWARHFAALVADSSGAGTLATVSIQAVRSM